MAKIYEQLPVVHQTTAVKNFFESTVEQLFAEANSEIITGFIGKKTSDDHNVDIAYLPEPTIDRAFYSLSPVVNTLNLTSGKSEDFVFFDEAVNTLKIYGANTINQNKLFSSDFKSFMPPVDPDKLLNFTEYYWDPETTGNCHTVTSWTANTNFTTNEVIVNGGSYYIANRNFTSSSTFVNDASLDTYNYTPDITQSKTAVVTTNRDHNFYSGDKIVITGVTGMTEVNNQTYYAEKVTSRTFKLFTDKDLRVPLDTTGFTTWASGGKIVHASGPTAISVSPTVENYIDIERDIIGKKNFTPAGGIEFKNGMVVTFSGSNVLSSTVTIGQEYVIEGVGTSIRLVDRSTSTSAPYSFVTGKDYIQLGRGSANKNVWSRNNFWWHKDNYLNSGDRIPNSDKRALRPILEYDADIELYDHGTKYKGSVDLSFADLTFEQANNLQSTQLVDSTPLPAGNVTPKYRCIFPNEDATISKNIYEITTSASTLSFSIVDTFTTGDAVSIHRGVNFVGLEYYYDGKNLKLAQAKPNRSSAPSFNLYKDDKTFLGDDTLYPFNNFEGNKVFAHKVGTGINDAEYGFPLSYKAFKSASEIEYENFALTSSYEYTPIGSTTTASQTGYFYYKLNKPTVEYHNLFKNTNKKSKQTIDTHHSISGVEIDSQQLMYFCGAVPNTDITKASGYDIDVKVNGKINTNYTYDGNGYIKFNSFDFVKGTLIDIFVYSDAGLISEQSISKYSIPLSWRSNPTNTEIQTISEPEYLHHFSNYLESQTGFTGNVLSKNNSKDLLKSTEHATDIVQSTQDTLLGTYLLDDKPHNLINAIRFNAKEYKKYKNRFKNELNNYFNNFDVESLSNEFVLEKIIRSVISFSVGRKVFNQTYCLPFGDNYVEESITISDTASVDYTPTNYYDLDKIENSLLVYKDRGISRTLLCVDKDYTFKSYNPITISLINNGEFNTGDVLVFKFYDSQRDSGQCPPTPSTLGLYPLYQPAKQVDDSYQTAQTLILGHDGSKQTIFGDRRDEILLEFENRLYNSAKAEFRNANSLGNYSAVNIRPGHFRTSDFEHNDWNNLLNLSFANWVKENNVDPIANDFYDLTNEFTWNYRGVSDLPGHWRGWYEYYYDTVRPHTHPWEMLGFTEKPSWWDSTYLTSTYIDYSSSNKTMWEDIEQGKIVSGTRENVANGLYKLEEFNPYRRIGLLKLLPITAEGTLVSPNDIVSTGSTTLTPTWTNTTPDTTQGYVTTSFRSLDSVNVKYDAANIYVLSNNIVHHNVTITNDSIDYIDAKEQQLRYNLPRINLNTITVGSQAQGTNPVGVAITGLPIFNIQDTETYGSSDYTYNRVEKNDSAFALGNTTSTGIQYYLTLNADIVGATAWGNATTHSGIVGWAFDGLPIYGPYGYTEYYANGTIKTNTITNIKSNFKLKTNPTRDSSIGGAHTGEFTQDFTYDASLEGTAGYVGGASAIGTYNTRYGFTPESPTTAIKFYVCTQDDAGNPMFPYHIGGGTRSWNNDTNGSSESMTYSNKFYQMPRTENAQHQGLFDSTKTSALLSIFTEVKSATNNINDQWKLGDGAPVENAWKYSVEYPFAVTEALLLAKPGLFATVFSDPTKILTPAIDSRSYISKVSRKKWNFADTSDFEIHGDLNSENESITNIGYTQFIHSWLNFQGLNSSDNFAQKLRTLNIKLGHRFAGFVDKDTMRLTLDQYSATGSSTNLILPSVNITVDIHDSAYKSRNYYSGVIVEKTGSGWKVRGYDKKLGYFDTLQLNTAGTTSSVQVGGNTVSHSTWTANVSYSNNAYVQYNGAYYRATSDVPSSATFNVLFWQSVGSLPQEGSATAVYYQQSTDVVEKVYYETEYADAQSLFNFLIALGRFQARAGYDLTNYDVSIADTRDWLFGAKQFLFWTTGSWQVGNTIELSPLADKLKFTPPSGFVSKVNRSERDMFSIMDQTGKAIEPTECDILREGTSIEITPPVGTEIYGIVLYNKEIEHAMVIDNVTDFADTIYEPTINQRQNRIKVKATRTRDWTGKLTTSGFIVSGDELIPNLDNLAQTMGKYTEQGFVPVERDVYEASRRLYGYQERSYLNELDITDDQQFDFYKGMIQNKGTGSSLSRIGRSSKIVQGEMKVYDEWAIKVGDFGDVSNNQSIELKIDRANVVQDPQLITLAFPQDTTGTVGSIDVVNAKHKYFNLPTITINNPTTGSNVATAVPTLHSNGEISSISVSNAGTGYAVGTGLIIETANITTANTSQIFVKIDAMSNEYVTLKEYDHANADLVVSSDLANITSLGSLTVTDASGASNVSATYNLGSITDLANIATFINTDATINSSITASVITNSGVSNVSALGNNGTNSNADVGYFTYLKISGNDFTLSDNDSNVTLGKLQLGDSSVRYQPRQRYKVSTANNTVKANIVVSVANATVSSSNFDFDLGGRWQVQPLADTLSGSVAYGLATTSTGITTNILPGTTTDIISGQQYIIKFTGSTNFTTLGASSNAVGTVFTATSTTTFTGNVTGTVAPTSFDTVNYTTIDNNDYAFVDVYIDGQYIENEGDVVYYTLTSNGITFANVDLLPKKSITTSSNVYIIEHSTIDFVDSFKGDVPGSTLNIKASTNDDITVRVLPVRNYEITPDASDDEIILIDIDDTSRFLKKPNGLRSDELWKTTSNVSALGITDSKFNPLPNAGYVNESNVSYSAFNVPSIAQLFGSNIRFKPEANDTIHVAKAENQDWNVYKLQDANPTLSFVEQDDTTETAYLYLNDVDLFSYVDNNAIGGTDNNRFLDYHLVIKDADLTDQFVVWTNQQVVEKKGVKISDFAGVNMLAANIVSIGPANVMSISNMESAPTDSTIAEANIISVNQVINGGAVTNGTQFDVANVSGISAGMKVIKDNLQVGSGATVTNVSGTTVTISENITAANGTTIGFTSGTITVTTNVYNLTSGDTVAFSEGLPTQHSFDVIARNLYTAVDTVQYKQSANTQTYTIPDQGYELDYIFHAGNSNVIPVEIMEATQFNPQTLPLPVIGLEYSIETLGNTNWNDVAGTSGVTYEVGDIFTSVNTGAGTGTVVPTVGTTFIDFDTITIPTANLTVSDTDVSFQFTDPTLLYLNIGDNGVSNVHVNGANIISVGNTIELQSNVTLYHGQSYVITEVTDTRITITSDDFPLMSTGYAEKIDIAAMDIYGVKYNHHSNIHTNTYSVSNVTSGGFTIQDANVTANVSADILTMSYFGKTRITADTVDHNLASGDVVKLIANAYSGYYYIESATEDTFVIDMPFNTGVSKSGSIIKAGLDITTDNAHGIDPTYAGKRIAVHMAEPDYYNRVYTVASVPSTTTLKIADAFSFADVANAQFTGWQANTTFAKGERILNGVVTYVAANAFTSGAEFDSTNLNVGRPALLTTIDHNKIKLNNTEIVLNDIKSEQDIVDSINNAMALRRGAVDNDHTQISFPMISGKNNDKLNPILGDYRQVAGLSPYVNADNIENSALGDKMSRAGTLNYTVNKKGFVNDSTNPLQAEGVTPATILNTGVANPAYLGSTNNYGLPTDPLRVPLFNFPDANGTPVPGSGTDSGAKPIIDPRKAFANISKKPCVDMCSPVIIPPTPVVPITGGGVVSPPQFTTTCYGGTILNPDNGNAGMKIVSATGHGKRRWTSDYSGYYTLNGSHAGFASQVGASRGKLRASALAGVMTWSDNGSTQRFKVQMKFSKAGTYYAHVFNAGRSGYNSRTYVTITGSNTGIGKVTSIHSGKEFNFNTKGNVQAFEVSADQTVTFDGVCRGGGNHWHGLCFHISASATGLESCAKTQLPVVSTTSGYANLPQHNNTTGNAVVSYHEQHNRNSNQTDNDYYTLTSSGMVEILFDMYSGGDRIDVYQGVSKGGENLVVASNTLQNVQKCTDSEKREITSKSGGTVTHHHAGQAQRGGMGGGRPATLNDFQYSGNNVKYAGKLAFSVDINNGTYLKVKVTKPSIVYRYVMKLPNNPVVPLPPTTNPQPGQPCNVAIYSPTAPTPVIGTQTPIYSPGGVPTTTKKKPTPGNQGGGGGYSGGGGGGAGYHHINSNLNNYLVYSKLGMGGGGNRMSIASSKHNVMHNYGGVGLAPMAGFSMIPSIFKKTVKTTVSNSYGKYQPLTEGQFVNNTVQRVTGNQILPLAQPLRNVAPSTPGKLRALDLENYPFWNELTYTGDNFYKKGNNFFTYTPGKINSDIRLQDGTLIGNVLDDFSISDGISGYDILLNYPGQIPTVLPNPSNGGIGLEPAYTLPHEDSPYESNVSFSESPVISIVPKIKDADGNYVPAGPAVYCDLSRPTPGHTIILDDMTGVKAGDELIINNTKIRFPGSDPKQVETALRCTQGSGYMVHDTFKDGKPALRVSSCSNAPLTVRDGCAGGIYREVLDFHVVRGFEQSETETSNTAVLPATTGYGYANTAVNPSSVYTMYNAAGTSTGQFSGTGGNPSTTTGAVLSSKTVSKSTGGSGYSVGDRLRIVGGLPIEDPYGGITEFCIDMPGMMYSSAENIKVYIGDGTTPGSGALAGAVTLNQDRGIASIQILSGGDGYDFARPPVIKIIDLAEGQTYNTTAASVTAKIGTGKGLPPRVAKFVVSSINALGTITSLQIIDRGIYKQFPSDLTQGVPLEYDAIGLGDETGVDGNGQYFQGTGLGQFDPLNDHERLDSPGAYDPIKGVVGGGTGARVFLTAREIPDCSEKGDAKRSLGIPDSVVDINIPEDIAACLNNALFDAGYDPDKIHIDIEPINDLIDLLKFRTPGYDGIEIDELTPGFLEKLGIPPGDYNIDSLCIDAVLETPNSQIRKSNKIESGTNLLDDNRFQIATLPDSPTIAINCIDTIGNGYDQFGNPLTDSGTGINGQDPNSILGNANVVFHTDMFQYELRSTSGEAVNTSSLQQECQVLYLESMRYPSATGNVIVKDSISYDINTFGNVWIDNYNDSGWAYFEGSNVASVTQPKLVDTTFVENAIIYDQDSGEKEYDLHFYDPFKGVIPGFIQKEIHFTSDSDPVVYNNARSGFGRKDIGKVWWNTSTVAYKWYEQGSNRERWLNWGKTFPGSGITLFEWVEDTNPPVNYTGTGIPKNTAEFVLERRPNPVNGRYTNYYYFWVQNKTTLESASIEDLGREYDTFTLAKYLADPIGSGLPLISFVSDKAMVLSNIAPLLREDEQNLQINFSRNLNPVGQKHTAWKLLRQDDNNSIVPDDLSNKLIDSLSGIDAIGQSVPDPLLSEVEAYGVKYRPRQSMFKDVKGARQVLHYTLNQILADLQLATNYPDWDTTLPASKTYLETVNWYGVQYTDAISNAKVRYDNTFKPIYKVNSVQELATLQSIPDNTIVQVKGPNVTQFSLHKYIAASKTFELISIQNDNIKLKTSVYTDSTNATLSSELRLLLVALRDNVFVGTNLWNKLFFALLKFAYSEQKQLDWAFKTSYVFIEKEEEDLIEINGFKVDNFDKVLQYFDEVKPYTSKIREYKDGKSPVREVIGTNSVSDFDKPPYADPVTGNVRILDDFLQADSNIIQTNSAYTKYFSVSDKSIDPIRHSNTTIKFDRVDYSLLPHDYQPAVNVATWTANVTYPRYSYVVNNNIYYKANIDIAGASAFNSTNWSALGSNISVIPVADTANSAIARNIVTVTLQSNADVQSNILVTASERAFKFNPAIQTQFAAELNTYYNITDATSNANVINSSNVPGSIANITAVVNAGSLNKTLALVKTGTGGDFQGETVDGNLFTRSYGVDTNTYQSQIGFNRTGWSSSPIDLTTDVKNYQGVFNTAITGNEVSFERDGVLYDGFDGVTFSRVLYGEERPQELALLEPLETLVLRVTTHANLSGNASLDSASSNASTVKFQMTNNIYGQTEFIRIKQDGTATTTTNANVYTYSDEISVADASILAKPKARIPGIIWVGTERIEYSSRNTNTNKLSGLVRGTNGTSTQNWASGTEVLNANKTEQFGSYPITSNIWLDSGAVSLSDLGNANISDSSSIMRFLHGRE
tara:strand:- start:6550 stop:24414 length:17865 start_codon:yes stop_codon:yes gene_type:complete